MSSSTPVITPPGASSSTPSTAIDSHDAIIVDAGRKEKRQTLTLPAAAQSFRLSGISKKHRFDGTTLRKITGSGSSYREEPVTDTVTPGFYTAKAAGGVDIFIQVCRLLPGLVGPVPSDWCPPPIRRDEKLWERIWSKVKVEVDVEPYEDYEDSSDDDGETIG